MTAYDDLVLAASPALYWPLDETAGSVAFDASGNGRHGTYNGSPTFGQAGPLECKEPGGGAAFFDGLGSLSTADFVYLENPPVHGSSDGTWEVWHRPALDSFTRPGRRYSNVIQQRDAYRATDLAYPEMMRLQLYDEAATMALRLRSPERIVAPLALVSDRLECWNHYAITKAGTLWTLYVNGAARGTYNFPGFEPSSRSLSFGADWTDWLRSQGADEQELIRGRMAKAAVYAHALTAEEIAARWSLGCVACRQGWAIGRVRIG